MGTSRIRGRRARKNGNEVRVATTDVKAMTACRIEDTLAKSAGTKKGEEKKS